MTIFASFDGALTSPPLVHKHAVIASTLPRFMAFQVQQLILFCSLVVASLSCGRREHHVKDVQHK